MHLAEPAFAKEVPVPRGSGIVSHGDAVASLGKHVKAGRDVVVQECLIEQKTVMRVHRRIVERVGYEARRSLRGDMQFTGKGLFCFFGGIVAQQVFRLPLWA
jgi:hypothetical protein